MHARILRNRHGIAAAIGMFLLLCGTVPAEAVPTVTVSPAGAGTFLVQGAGIENASAFEIILSYDPAALANPRVTTGPLIAGSLTAVNANTPGVVRLLSVRVAPVNGSGVIATMVFDSRSPSSAPGLSLSARLTDLNGNTLPVLARVALPPPVTPGEPAEPSGTDRASGSPPVIVQGGGPAGGGSAGPSGAGEGPGPGPATIGKQEDRSAEEGNAEEYRADEDRLAKRDAQEAAPRKLRTFQQEGVLDRFEQYRGAATPQDFVALFRKQGIPWCRQDPRVILSDGTSSVHVSFLSVPGNRTASDISVVDARLVSFQKDPENTNMWIVELVPERGTYRAQFSVVQNGVEMVCPLTVAPRIVPGPSGAGTMTAAGFRRYVRERRTAQEAWADVNKDGRRDAVDDFIATANYLAGRASSLVTEAQ